LREIEVECESCQESGEVELHTRRRAVRFEVRAARQLDRPTLRLPHRSSAEEESMLRARRSETVRVSRHTVGAPGRAGT
jgi:hypothetical protein